MVRLAAFLAGRVIMAALTLLLVSLIIFVTVEVLPGDIARRILGREAPEAALAALRAKLQLDLPGPQRYLNWLGGLLRGDLGTSIASRLPVSQILAPKLWNSFLLSLLAFVLYVPLSLAAAMVQAVWRGTPLDHAVTIVTVVLSAFPEFLLATILLLLFGVILPILPPLSNVGPGTVPKDYVAAARLRGEGTFSIIRREILPNCSGVLLVEFAIRAGYAPVLIGSFGFLGFGMRPPSPEWGLMISEYRNLIVAIPITVIGPCVMLASLIIGLNLVTEGAARALGRSLPKAAS